MKWTKDNIPQQNGKTCIVTGANSGIGYHMSLELARKGARVIMACRNHGKATEAMIDIKNELPDAKITLMHLDLSDIDVIITFAANFLNSYDRLDILINNAGIMYIPERRTWQDFEMQFGVNHLGHFALTGLLNDIIMKTPASRVVTVSSNLHKKGKIEFEDLNWKKRKYDKRKAYAQSKLANILFSHEYQRRLNEAKSHTLSLACHPGYASTNLQMQGPLMEKSSVSKALMKASSALFAQSAAMGALPALYAATAEDVHGGEYFGPDGFAHIKGYPAQEKIKPRFLDNETSARLWDISESLTGIEYNFNDPAERIV